MDVNNLWLWRTEDKNGMLSLRPHLPKAWNRLSFKILFRKHLFNISVDKDNVVVEQERGDSIRICIYGSEYTIKESDRLQIPVEK